MDGPTSEMMVHPPIVPGIIFGVVTIVRGKKVLGSLGRLRSDQTRLRNHVFERTSEYRERAEAGWDDYPEEGLQDLFESAIEDAEQSMAWHLEYYGFRVRRLA